MFKKTALLTILMVIQSSPAWSDEAADMKQAALASCEDSIILMTEYEKLVAVDKCKCIVEKTDYTVVISGDKTKIEENLENNTVACSLRSAM